MGFTLAEAYGLTETCPGLTTNLPERMKLGTVGLAFPNVQIKDAGDGRSWPRVATSPAAT